MQDWVRGFLVASLEIFMGFVQVGLKALAATQINSQVTLAEAGFNSTLAGSV
jgi:hypothetical protein